MKKLFLFFTVVTCSLMMAAEPAGKPERPPRKPGGPQVSGKRRVQHIFWRAFSELSEQERKEMLELQRNDQEKFREVMNKKVEAILNAEKAERSKMENLVKQYRNSRNEAEKEAVKKEISAILSSRFAKRLASNRRHLEAMKRRTAHLEKELDARAANADKIINIQVESILKGKPERPAKPGFLRPGTLR